jgi:hypothetical protein
VRFFLNRCKIQAKPSRETAKCRAQGNKLKRNVIRLYAIGVCAEGSLGKNIQEKSFSKQMPQRCVSHVFDHNQLLLAHEFRSKVMVSEEKLL